MLQYLGEGGAGRIYRARDTRTRDPLAVKVLRADRPDHLDGLVREIHVLHQIRSPWVVRFERAGVLLDGRPWLAMEFLEGPTLAQALGARRRTDVVQVLRWLRQACRGLAAIHRAGWAHRDVKPSNFVLVHVRDGERLKVIDLGIAACFGDRPQELSGTPSYIAPEQIEGGPVDLRSDVYALGCCAYEMLTGESIVRQRDPVAKLRAHRDGFVIAWPHPAAVPPALRQLVERCVAHDPERRPQSMDELAAELVRIEAT